MTHSGSATPGATNDDNAWVTQAEAAALTGVPVSTIDWYQRQRTSPLRTRPRRGSLPTIERDSALAFGQWWHERDSRADLLARAAERRRAAAEQRDQQGAAAEQELVDVTPERAQQRSPSSQPAEQSPGVAREALEARGAPGARPTPQPTAQPPAGVAVRHAAQQLQLGRDRVLQLIHAGELAATKHQGRWYIAANTLVAFRAARIAWVSIAEAAHLAGVTTTRIHRAIAEGNIEQRPDVHGLPTLSRGSVEAFVSIARQERRDAARLDRAATEHAARRRANATPPDRDHTWLTLSQAGEQLGVSRSRVGQLIDLDLLPHERRGRRVWIREDLLSLVRNARTARQRPDLLTDPSPTPQPAPRRSPAGTSTGPASAAR